MEKSRTKKPKTKAKVRYIAVCNKGDNAGPWRDTYEEALDDSNKHMLENPGHIAVPNAEQ